MTRSFAISPADGVRDWVDVPLGRLEQYQRHIDPVAPPGDAAAATALTVAVPTGRFYPAGGSAIMAVPISRKPILA